MTKNKNEIATKKETGLMFSVDESALNRMSEDSKTYVDDASPDDIAMPRLRILQSGSEQAKKSNKAEYVDGAEEGDFFNTLSRAIAKGDEGLLFVPAKRRVVYLEWKDRAAGGGLVNNFGEDSSEFLEANVGENGKRISKRGNEIVKTYDFFGHVIDMKAKTASEVVISMSKTQAKKARHFYSLIRNLTDKKTGRQLPEYAGVYQLTTVPESNDKGSWYNFDINFAGYTLGVPEIGTQIYNKSESFAKLIAENKAKVAYEDEDTGSASAEDRV